MNYSKNPKQLEFAEIKKIYILKNLPHIEWKTNIFFADTVEEEAIKKINFCLKKITPKF